MKVLNFHITPCFANRDSDTINNCVLHKLQQQTETAASLGISIRKKPEIECDTA